MLKNAVVVRERGVNLDGDHHPKGAVIHLPRNQFEDLESVGIVREATDAQVEHASANAKPDKPARKPRPAKTEAADETGTAD